ncbi:MAG TPA: CvpA family protein [Tepidisphaeraceae bacterium]|nr:CvpA family protein [Tepidisphaeraceae bacterium]
MLLTIVVILLVIAVTFVHYLQGFFSATLSAILTILAAVLAFSWHEGIAEHYMLKSAILPDGADAFVLVALFALIYIILRTIFDKAIPGGIQLPAGLDKVGGGVMGLIAAAFSVGILIIAAQEMGFNASIGGYTRFKTIAQRGASIKKNIRQEDSNVVDELQSNTLGGFDPNDRQMVYPPVDDIVMATLTHLSDGGSLAGSQPISDFHPAFLAEMYGQRAGIQAKGTLVALSRTGLGPPVAFDSLYTVPGIPTVDYLPETVRDKPFHRKLTGTLAPGVTYGDGQRVGKDTVLLVARVIFNRSASEVDHLVRFSPGSIRLVAMQKDPDTGQEAMADYYPWGVVQEGKLYVTKPDDFLFADMTSADHCAIDLLYVVDKIDIASGNRMAPGSFIEVKRSFREDLSGMQVLPEPKPLQPGNQPGVMISWEEEKPKAPAPTKSKPQENVVKERINQAMTPIKKPVQNNGRGSFTSAQANVGAIGGGIFNFQKISQSALLPAPVAVPEADLAKPTIEVPATGVEAIVKDRKFLSLTVKPVADLAALAKGDFKTRELSVPDGQTLIQLSGTVRDETWAQKVPEFELVTTDNKRLKAHGVWALMGQGQTAHLLASYSTDYEAEAQNVTGGGTPSEVVLAFLVPNGVKAKELDLGGVMVKDLSQEPVSNGP